MRNKINKYRDVILLTIGTLLVILSLCLLFYDRIELLKSNVFAEVEMEKYHENNLDGENEEEIVTDDVDIDIDYVEESDEEGNPIENKTLTKEEEEKKKAREEANKKAQAEREKIAKEFIGYLEIKKINLKQGLVSKKSYYNDVKYNIQMISTSDYPDKNLGNVILAAHSGTGYLAFFKNLYKLNKGDEAKITYKNYVYTYKIVNIYNVLKTGTVKINRDVHKTTLTLITCTHNSKTEQTVYILELSSKVKAGGSK